jgi:hypothetical protein
MQDFVMAHPWLTFFMFGAAVRGLVALFRGYRPAKKFEGEDIFN